ncbi:MAG TPA: hypothetical protein VIK95_07030 [Egibacteraceae bacterium]
MFSTYCAICGARTLIWASQIDGVSNSDAGIVVHFHDSAGHPGTFVTGRATTAIATA